MNTFESNAKYGEYMSFKMIDHDPWTVNFLSTHLHGLGVPEPEVTYDDVEKILWCYDQAPMNRYYHGPDHGAFVGQPDVPPALAKHLSERLSLEEARSVLAIAGLFHDVAYKHVDEIDQDGTRAWPAVLRDQIGDSVTYTRTVEDDKPVFRTIPTERGSSDAITQLVIRLFDVGEEGIIHNKGGNEFDSALAAAKFLEEKGAPLKSIIAVVSAIAATVPFKPAVVVDGEGQVTDGHMGELAQRVKTALEETGVSPAEYAWQDTNDIMYLGVYLANRDISPFVQPDNFAQVVHGGRGVKAEEVPALRGEVKTIRHLARAAGLQRSAPLLYGWLKNKDSPVPAKNVPHIYILRDTNGQLVGVEESYPPLDVYEQAVEHTERNTRLANQYFVAHELGIVLTAAIATHIGEPDAPVPGIVHAQKWHIDAVVKDTSHLTEDEYVVYLELLRGVNQKSLDSVTTRRSPIGAIIFGTLGSEGAGDLSEYVQEIRRQYDGEDPFSDPEIATAFIGEVKTRLGDEAFKIITTEMQRVARYFQDDQQKGKLGREALIGALSDSIR